MSREAAVLLVGVDDETAEIACSALDKRWSVTTVKNGASAEEAVRKRAHTVIIVDWDARNFSALELVKSALGWNRMTSVLALVNSNRKKDATSAIDAGAMACLVKPVDGDDLASLVARAHEKARLNRELATATHRTQELIDAIGEFLASVSHDLRTPLAIMHGYAETLLHYGDKLDREKRAAYLNYIRDGSRKLTQQMAEFLDLSRKGVSVVSPEKIDMPRLVGEVFRPACEEERALQLEVQFEPEAQEIVTDKKRLTHALQYAISEALQHSADGSKIWVRGLRNGGGIVIHIADRKIDHASMTESNSSADIGCEEAQRMDENQEPNISITIARCILKVLGGDIWSHQNGDGYRLTFTLPKEYKPSKRNHG